MKAISSNAELAKRGQTDVVTLNLVPPRVYASIEAEKLTRKFLLENRWNTLAFSFPHR